MGNKFTTPGGFAPTPSTCYPWPPYGPPIPPIPCLQGPIPSLVNVQSEIDVVNNLGTSSPNNFTIGGSGLAIYGTGVDYSNLTASLPNGNVLQLNVELQCHELGAGGYEWLARLVGRWLNPAGHVLDFSLDLNPFNIVDLSVPGSYVMVQASGLTNTGIVDNWLATNTLTTWYTSGAPL
jgi:hypothetical protein